MRKISLPRMSPVAGRHFWCVTLTRPCLFLFRCPNHVLQALVYYYTRTLIQRPAVGSSLDQKAVPALISISNSSKHIIQIIELLEERNMTFSFCLNKTDVLVVCGMTLLYQTLALKHDSKLSKEAQRLVNRVVKMLIDAKAPGSLDFKRISSMIVKIDDVAPPTPPQSSPDASSYAGSHRESPSTNTSETAQNQGDQSLGRLTSASASETDLLQQQAKLRRMTMPSGGIQRPDMFKAQGRRSLDTSSPGQPQPRQRGASQHTSPPVHGLDYLSLNSGAAAQQVARMQMQGRQANGNGNGMTPSQSQRLAQMYHAGPSESKMNEFSPAQWEALLGSLDGGQTNVYDAIYGGPSPLPLHEPQPMPADPTQTVGAGWLEEPWSMTGFNMGDFDGGAQGAALTMSEESVSPPGETAQGDLGLGVNNLDLGDGLQRCGTAGYMNGLESEFIL